MKNWIDCNYCIDKMFLLIENNFIDIYMIFFFYHCFYHPSISRRETRSEMARKTGLKRIGHALRSSRESGVMWVTLLLLLLLYNKRNSPVIAGRVALKNNYPTFRRSGKFAASDSPRYFLSKK